LYKSFISLLTNSLLAGRQQGLEMLVVNEKRPTALSRRTLCAFAGREQGREQIAVYMILTYSGVRGGTAYLIACSFFLSVIFNTPNIRITSRMLCNIIIDSPKDHKFNKSDDEFSGV
jgi:hypothetical protein